MRRLLLGLAVAAALAIPAAASAQLAPPTDVICGTACDGGGSGWTGCTTVTGNDQGGVPGIAFWHHYLIVDYCKVNGLITRLSITAHGCDTSGFAFCNLGPAWISSRRRRRGLGVRGRARLLRHDGEQAHRAQLHERRQRLDLDGVMPPRWVLFTVLAWVLLSVVLTLARHPLPAPGDDALSILDGRGASSHDRRGPPVAPCAVRRGDRCGVPPARLRAARAALRDLRQSAAAHHRDRHLGRRRRGTTTSLGFASSWTRGDDWFLSSLFVAPGAQGGGLGRQLLTCVWDEGARRRRTITDAIQPVSNALYASRGLVPTTPLLTFSGEPLAADVPLLDEVIGETGPDRRGGVRLRPLGGSRLLGSAGATHRLGQGRRARRLLVRVPRRCDRSRRRHRCGRRSGGARRRAGARADARSRSGFPDRRACSSKSRCAVGSDCRRRPACSCSRKASSRRARSRSRATRCISSVGGRQRRVAR